MELTWYIGPGRCDGCRRTRPLWIPMHRGRCSKLRPRLCGDCAARVAMILHVSQERANA